MAKTYIATRQEVTTITNSVTTLNTTVNDPTTGLTTRVTNLEAGGGAGMTPQQVADLAACVVDKHTHANKAVLDLTEAAYTTAEKTKLGNLTDNFKGLFADAAARNAAVTTPLSGNYVLQEDTNTVWYYNGSSWLNTGVTASGDMLKAVYDPNNKQLDAFSMDSMVETATKKIFTANERSSLSFYRGHMTDAAAMNALTLVADGHFCTRADTGSVWIHMNSAWVNSTSGLPSIGDTKFSYKTVDHDGWYILDGRSVSTLSSYAQASAASMGWNTIIPNTRGRYALAASPTFNSGTQGGTSYIDRASLPNFTIAGTTGTESASHTHTTAAYTISEATASDYATSSGRPHTFAFASTSTVFRDNGSTLAGTDQSYAALSAPDRDIDGVSTFHNHLITIDVPSKISGNANSTHTHAFTVPSINGGVTQTAHFPTYSAKTEFVYLGL